MTGPVAKKAVAKKAPESYVVSGARIQVRFGDQVLQYSAGDVLPNGIDEDNLKHLLDNELVRKGELVTEAPSSDDE